MFKISKKFVDRVNSKLKNYQAITSSQRIRDVSEADTVTVVKDILSEIFGFDKYTELTSEQKIKGTFCDLAIKIEGKVIFLIEVKASALELNNRHLQQAINYGANQGIEWVALTNSIEWRLYKIKFDKPIEHELVTSFSISTINPKNEDDLKKMFLLAREGFSLDAIGTFHATAQILNKYTISQLLLTEPILSTLRRELRKLFPDTKIELDAIADLLLNEILKREVIEGEKVKDAQLRLKKAFQKMTRIALKKQSSVSDESIDTKS
jgi:ribosome-binding ATPase YchF (GTP1/OBG family)